VAAGQILQSILGDVTPKLPQGFEQKLLLQVTNYAALDTNAQSGVYEQCGAAALVQGNLDVTQRAFARACQINSARDSSLANLGFILGQSSRPQDGLALLFSAAQINLQAGCTYNNMGWAFARSGQLDLASKYYRLATQYAPKIGQYHLNLGAVLLRQNISFDAEQEFEAAMSYGPGDRQAISMVVALK
jgi:tetratricopeptide (TPR) repeat protein